MNCFLTPLVPKRRVISTPSTLFFDIYQNSRFADFMIENGGRKVAIEIDDEPPITPSWFLRISFMMICSNRTA